MVTQIVRTNGLIDIETTASVALMNNYLLHWARNPDPGSWFDWMTFWRHWVSDQTLLHWLVTEWNTPGINKVRISAGNDEAVAHMYESVLSGAYHLPFEVTRGNGPGWVNLIR